MPIRNTEQQLVHIYYTLFLQVHSAADPCTCHGNWSNYAEPKPFSSVKPGMCWSCFIHFYCGGSDTEHRWRCSTKVVWSSKPWGPVSASWGPDSRKSLKAVLPLYKELFKFEDITKMEANFFLGGGIIHFCKVHLL